MLRASSEHIPPYGQSNQTLEKYCKPCKPVSRTANPGPNRIEDVAILFGVNLGQLFFCMTKNKHLQQNSGVNTI